MQLTSEQQQILDGSQGPVLQKVMKSVVAYGEAFGAEKLVPIEGNPHLVTSFGANSIKPYFAVLDELIEAGLKTKEPFTVDPRPMEYETLDPGFLNRTVFKFVFGKQAEYEQQLQKLGLKDGDAFTCACYFPEVGNRPRRGAYLAWSESSAVVFANSVLGALTNRNSSGIDLMCDILGLAPLFGLMTPEGRQAAWQIDVQTAELPNPQLLGSAIGLKVMEDVPYIRGLEKFLGSGLNEHTESYLKDMGAAGASNGAVGLYHVEGVTPEAVEQGQALLKPGYKTYVIDEAELKRVKDNYPILWKDLNARPERIFIGCPHLSLEQLESWQGKIDQGLKTAGRQRATVPTTLFTAPQVRREYQERHPQEYQLLLSQDVHVSTICPLMYMNNPLAASHPIATCSNKLRTYTSARFYLEEEVLPIIIHGDANQGGKHG
jgi:predicted aconitase